MCIVSIHENRIMKPVVEGKRENDGGGKSNNNTL
jgi:hypothetical protein